MASKKIRIKKKYISAMKKSGERFRFKLINKLIKRSIIDNKCVNPFSRTRHRNIEISKDKYYKHNGQFTNNNIYRYILWRRANNQLKFSCTDDVIIDNEFYFMYALTEKNIRQPFIKDSLSHWDKILGSC